MQPLIVFAPGAGAPSSSPWMLGWRRRLEALGEVHAFDYPYMKEGRKRPDPLARLVAAHREAIARARAGRDLPLVLIGKSMGSRVGCHVAAETDEDVAVLVCLGYPLVGQSGSVRDQVLLSLRTPVLFVQGTRDPLCPLDRLEQIRSKMSARSELHVADGGDHSLLSTKTRLEQLGSTQVDEDERVLQAIGRFLAVQEARGAR